MSNQDQPGKIISIVADIVAIMAKMGSALENHEQRLQALESLNLKTQLLQLKRAINAIADPKTRAETLASLHNLCDSLGIQDAEP